MIAQIGNDSDQHTHQEVCSLPGDDLVSEYHNRVLASPGGRFTDNHGAFFQ